VPLHDHQVDVIKILATAKAVSKVIPRIHRRPKFAATGTLKTEVTITVLCNRTVTTKPQYRQLHRKVIAYRAE
jgi:hypothetical protein